MFVPTKAHKKFVAKNQPSIRLGNRVPKDAVNLAYTYLPPIRSDENVLITDLSNTILENTKNLHDENVWMYPDETLLLQLEDGTTEFPTDDVIMTNVFKDNVPLYYSQQLSYKHYDKEGPDAYGNYKGEGISIVDRFGKKIDRPYQVKLIADPNYHNLYTIVVYTSFKDEASDTYKIVYNAVEVGVDLEYKTIAGYRETLNLQRAFYRTNQLQELIAAANDETLLSAYYQSNSVRPGYNQFYVSTPRVLDERPYEKFRYQIGVEIDYKGEQSIITTPWFSDSVLDHHLLIPEERKNYLNEYKQLTLKTAEEIMMDYIPDEILYNAYAKKSYTVNIDSPTRNIKEFFRVDGTSPIYASIINSAAMFVNNIPPNAKVIAKPVTKDSKLMVRYHPLKAKDTDVAYISFVMDSSGSMKKRDTGRALRYRMMKDILTSARDYYKQNKMNAYGFNVKTVPIREEFKKGDDDLMLLYKEMDDDESLTKPIAAIQESMASFSGIPSTYIENNITYETKKTIVFITDGNFTELAQFAQCVTDAKALGISLCVISYNNTDDLKAICDANHTLFINGKSSKFSTDLRYFFFNLGGLTDCIDIIDPNTSLPLEIPFTMSPTENELKLSNIRKNPFDPTFTIPDKLVFDLYPGAAGATTKEIDIPAAVKDDRNRFAIQVFLQAESDISIYFQNPAKRKKVSSINATNLIRVRDLYLENAYDIYSHSIAYDYYFAPLYALKYNDNRSIQVLAPREIDAHLSWYPRIKNGRFDLDSNEDLFAVKSKTITYNTDEQWRQGIYDCDIKNDSILVKEVINVPFWNGTFSGATAPSSWLYEYDGSVMPDTVGWSWTNIGLSINDVQLIGDGTIENKVERFALDVFSPTSMSKFFIEFRLKVSEDNHWFGNLLFAIAGGKMDDVGLWIYKDHLEFYDEANKVFIRHNMDCTEWHTYSIRANDSRVTVWVDTLAMPIFDYVYTDKEKLLTPKLEFVSQIVDEYHYFLDYLKYTEPTGLIPTTTLSAFSEWESIVHDLGTHLQSIDRIDAVMHGVHTPMIFTQTENDTTWVPLNSDGTIASNFGRKLQVRVEMPLDTSVSPLDPPTVEELLIRYQALERIPPTEKTILQHYSIPEYYRQTFVSGKGMPIRRVIDEKPEILNETQVRVMCTPLSIDYQNDDIQNVHMTVNGKPIKIKSWNVFNGIFEVDGTITYNDNIRVSYEYEEDDYVYRGYYDQATHRFWKLDLNPTEGHYTTMKDKYNGEIKDVPSVTLINETIYIYIRPSVRVVLGNQHIVEKVVNLYDFSIFHTFEKISDIDAILIGEIRIRPNSNQRSLELVDSRVRGGGLKEEIVEATIQEFESESIYYWDIGHWDGQPYPENGVVTFRITRSVLKEYGGQFTKTEVEEKLNKHLGYGILPIIEFVDDPLELLQIPQDLVVEVIDVEDDLNNVQIPKPTFHLTVEG